MNMSLLQAVSYRKLCIPDQTEYFSSQWQHHQASQTQGLLTDMHIVVREGEYWSKVGLHRAVILPHLMWMEEVHGDNPVILLPDFSLEVLESVTSLLYSGAVNTSPSIKVEDVMELMDALGFNISRNCMIVNKCVIPGQGQVDTEERYHDNYEYSEEENNNNIGGEQYQGSCTDTFMSEHQEEREVSSGSKNYESETCCNNMSSRDSKITLLEDTHDNDLSNEDSQINVKYKRKIIAQNEDPGKKLKVKYRSESIQALLDYDDAMFDDDLSLSLSDEGTIAKTDEDIKDMMDDAAELLEECTEEPQSRSLRSVSHGDQNQNTAARYKKLSTQSYDYENEACKELVPVTGASEFDLVDQGKITDARKAMVNDFQYMLKEMIESDNDDHDLQINTNISIDAGELEESVNSNNEPVVTAVQYIDQGKDVEGREVVTDRSDKVNILNIVSDQLISCKINEAFSQSDKLSRSDIENVDEDVDMKRKVKVDAGSDSPVRGETSAFSRLRRDCRGVCPLCNKEYSIKMLSNHAARCKGVI